MTGRTSALTLRVTVGLGRLHRLSDELVLDCRAGTSCCRRKAGTLRESDSGCHWRNAAPVRHCRVADSMRNDPKKAMPVSQHEVLDTKLAIASLLLRLRADRAGNPVL